MHSGDDSPLRDTEATAVSFDARLVPVSPVRAAAGTLPAAVGRPFNRSPLDRKDPFESAGLPLDAFTFSSSFPVSRTEQEALVRDMHAALAHRLGAGSLPRAALQLVDFDDVAHRDEPARRYVAVSVETTRKTHMSVYTQFMPYGEHLYTTVRSYILPPLSVTRLVLTVLFALALYAVVSPTTSGFTGLVLALGVMAWTFRGVIRNVLAGDDPVLALRKRFPRKFNSGTFNTDDTLAFFKSAMNLNLHAIQEVFERHDVPIDVIERARQQFNSVTNINTGAGTINSVGSVLGGIGISRS